MSKELNETSGTESNSPETGRRIQIIIENGKRRFAEFLKLQAERLTKSQQKIILVCSGILIAAVCLFLMVYPFIQPTRSTQIPGAGSTTTVLSQPYGPALSEHDYKMLRDFIRTIDSLKYYDPMTYEDAIKGREGLVDSIRVLLSIKP